MLFNSLEFIFLFAPISLVLFFLLGKLGKSVLPIAWLVLASLFFYAWWEPKYLVLLMASMAFNYLVGQLLVARVKKKWLLIVGVSANLAVLAYYKYSAFFVQSLEAVLNQGWHFEPIVLPLAISFFTFLQIAYLVDSYRGVGVEASFLNYCLFVTFYPHLVAGPLVHHLELLPQFAADRTKKVDLENICVGASIFAVGLFKKVVIADSIAVYAEPVFTAADAGGVIPFFVAWRGALAYTFQLYFDFSGYADMAIGISKMFNVLLPINFDSPYRSLNIADFWRRWHITLSRFLRDYLYISLGGNRRGPTRRYINLFLTMVLGGLWHGANWTFAVWGALHGFYLVGNHAWHFFLSKYRGQRLPNFVAAPLSMVATFLLVVIGWVFFKATTFDGALRILSGMADVRSASVVDVSWEVGLWCLGCYVICVFWPNTQTIFLRFNPALGIKNNHGGPVRFEWQPSYFWALLSATMLCMSLYLLVTRGYVEFIYRFF